MGNSDSSQTKLTPHEKINAIIASPRYYSIKKRIEKMGIELTIQGDGSLYLQNPRDLVKGNCPIAGPDTLDDVESKLDEIIKTLDLWSQNCDYISFH